MLALLTRPTADGPAPTIPRRRFLATAAISVGAVALGIRPRRAEAVPAPAASPATAAPTPDAVDTRPPRTSDLTPEELDAYVRWYEATVEETLRVFPDDFESDIWIPFDSLIGLCARRPAVAALRPAKVWRSRGKHREQRRIERQWPLGSRELRDAYTRFWHVLRTYNDRVAVRHA